MRAPFFFSSHRRECANSPLSVLWYYCRLVLTLRKSIYRAYFTFLSGVRLRPLKIMAPLTKDTLEAANTTTEAAAPKIGAPAKSAQGGGNMRADAVSLEIPVKVHGSKVTEVVREVTPHTEPFEEQTSTMIVFPQGGVVRMSTSVSVGQMLVVTNLKSRQDAICRVVKVRTFSNLQGYVEVEFPHPQPGYWGVYFPSDGSARPNRPAPSVASAVPEPIASEAPAPPVSSASEISWAPAASAISATQKPLDPIPFAANA